MPSPNETTLTSRWRSGDPLAGRFLLRPQLISASTACTTCSTAFPVPVRTLRVPFAPIAQVNRSDGRRNVQRDGNFCLRPSTSTTIVREVPLHRDRRRHALARRATAAIKPMSHARPFPSFIAMLGLPVVLCACQPSDTKDPSSTESLACELELEPEPALHAVYDASIAPFACDPFMPPPGPTQLRAPVLVGRTDRGDTFLIDSIEPAHVRVFASEAADGIALADATLIEARSEDDSWTMLVAARAEFFQGLAISMPWVGTPPDRELDHVNAEVAIVYDQPIGGFRPATALAEGHALTSVSDCTTLAAELPPRERWWGLVYFFEVEGGTYLVVMRLLDYTASITKAEYFLFHGTDESLVQRALSRFSRRLDGQTELSFELPSGTATAFLPGACDESPVGSLCPGELTIEGQTLLLTPHVTEAVDRFPEMRFECQFSFSS